MDHVSAHVLVGSRMSKIYDFCGAEIPPPLMSAKNILTLDYIVKSIGNGRQLEAEDDYGFVIEYRFIPDWGPQPPEVQKNPNKRKLSLSLRLSFYSFIFSLRLCFQWFGTNKRPILEC